MKHLLAVFTDNPLKRRGYSNRERMFWATKDSGVCNSMKTSVQVMREDYSQLQFIVLTTLTMKWVRLKHKSENTLVFSKLLNFQPCITFFRAYFPKITVASLAGKDFPNILICVYHEAELVL